MYTPYTPPCTPLGTPRPCTAAYPPHGTGRRVGEQKRRSRHEKSHKPCEDIGLRKRTRLIYDQAQCIYSLNSYPQPINQLGKARLRYCTAARRSTGRQGRSVTAIQGGVRRGDVAVLMCGVDVRVSRCALFTFYAFRLCLYSPRTALQADKSAVGPFR